ncbi:MAG: hypothetical protein IJ002_03730 [Clostridia bacterium]|nr:hypothetical protein [Clostridia bacterium]
MNKKMLIIGATGAMGTYLTQKAVAAGYDVDAVTLVNIVSGNPHLRYITVNDAKDPEFVGEITKTYYDVVFDLMIYNSISFRETFPKYLANCGQYFYFSSCRVYANEANPIVESSPRLLDVTTDRALLFSDDYCMHKARGEDALRASSFKNFTIVRPSTTYSVKRCQLLTLERKKIMSCVRSGDVALLDEAARNIPASLTWAGDVADMLMGLVGKEEALCNDYNVTSSKSNTWGEIAEFYKEIFGLKYKWVDGVTYQKFRDAKFDPEKSLAAIWQMKYARLFNRVYDNSKILNITGLKEDNFKSLYEGLLHERESIIAED